MDRSGREAGKKCRKKKGSSRHTGVHFAPGAPESSARYCTSSSLVAQSLPTPLRPSDLSRPVHDVTMDGIAGLVKTSMESANSRN